MPCWHASARILAVTARRVSHARPATFCCTVVAACNGLHLDARFSDFFCPQADKGRLLLHWVPTRSRKGIYAIDGQVFQVKRKLPRWQRPQHHSIGSLLRPRPSKVANPLRRIPRVAVRQLVRTVAVVCARVRNVLCSNIVKERYLCGRTCQIGTVYKKPQLAAVAIFRLVVNQHKVDVALVIFYKVPAQ